MRQYTRIYLDSNGNVAHVHTQETPILHEPVESPEVVSALDQVIEHGGPFERARPILESIESDGAGGVRVRANARSRAVREGVVRELTADERKNTR